MLIGIDISQIVYKGTGVGRYVCELVYSLLEKDNSNNYILFAINYSDNKTIIDFYNKCKKVNRRVQLKIIKLPVKMMEILWNYFGLFSIEKLIGKMDIFWSSDWIQPPLQKTIGITTIHDLSIYKYPESFNKKIINVHKRKLIKSKKYCKFFFCDSEATKKDANEILNIPLDKIEVIYPGIMKG